MAEVLLKNICKIYDGGVKAVDNVNVDIKDQEFRQAVESPQHSEWSLVLRTSPQASCTLTASL